MRALRGGSWNNEAQNLRCDTRNRNNPNNNWNNNGFRVVCLQSRPNFSVRALMPVFHGIPDRGSGMTCDSLAGSYARSK